MTQLFAGKRGLIMGVANNKSIAWGIAQELKKHGAELAFSYAGEMLKKRVDPLAAEMGSDIVIECNVTDDDSIEAMFKQLGDKWGKIDFVVHAIAFSDKSELQGRYLDTTRANFKNSLDISAFSFTAVAQAAEPYLSEDASLLTLSYFGAEKFVSNYNVMGVAKAALEASLPYLAQDFGVKGIRVNAISAGPIKTLAASAIGGFRKMLDYNETHAPMRRNVTINEVGKTAVWLLSDLGSGVTGEVVHVDAGAFTVGVSVAEKAD